MKNIKYKLKNISWIAYLRNIYYNMFPKKSISKDYLSFYKRKLSWENPKYLSEQIQLLKYEYYPNNYLVCQAADKFEIKNYLTNKNLEQYNTSYYKVFYSSHEIDYKLLPEQFVLKKTNGSGMNLIVKNKKNISEVSIKNITDKWMKTPFSKTSLEYHYDKVKSKIILEPLFDLGDEVRFFMVDGRVAFIQIIVWENPEANIEGQAKHFRLHLDQDWNILWNDKEVEHYDFNKPIEWQILENVALKISEDFPVVRVDFNQINSEWKISELTFTPASGFLEILKQKPKLDRQLFIKKDF